MSGRVLPFLLLCLVERSWSISHFWNVSPLYLYFELFFSNYTFVKKMKSPTIVVVVAALLALLCAAKKEAPLKLTKLVVLNRHGHRAPNGPYWTACPNDAYNLKKYDVDVEDLSGLGMAEEFQFGKFIRTKYSSFIGETYNREDFFLRAVGVPRCIQSAMALAQGVFPNGFGPQGWLPGRPQFVSIFSDLDMHEYMLDDTPCWARSAQDQKEWYSKYFALYMADPTVHGAINELIKFCGAAYPATDDEMALFVKLVVDGVVFNHDYGLQVLNGNVNNKLMFELRNISIQFLLGRLFDTDLQKTYGPMDFPNQLLYTAQNKYTARAYDDFMHPLQKVQVFVGHREELYGFAEFFGIKIQVEGLPFRELPVSSSFIFEILTQDVENGQNKTFIKSTLWTPTNGEYSLAIPGCSSPRLCTVEELEFLVNQRNARTGTWRKICNYATV